MSPFIRIQDCQNSVSIPGLQDLHHLTNRVTMNKTADLIKTEQRAAQHRGSGQQDQAASPLTDNLTRGSMDRESSNAIASLYEPQSQFLQAHWPLSGAVRLDYNEEGKIVA